jgi:dihydrodipicolinate synthase/N-acetylneuraminate lyase
MARKIGGIVLPVMTPFKEDGEVDESMGIEIVDFVINAGVHALFLLGSFGQGPVMTIEQRKRFAEVIVRHVRSKVPVIIHVGTADVYSTTELGIHAKSLGCEAIAAVGPYYYSDHTEFEVMEHYREVGNKVQMPLMIYNNPPCQGYDISPTMMLRIKEQVPQVFGTKLSADSLEIALAYLSQLPSDFSIFGLASSLLPGVLYGVRGTIIPPMVAFPELGVALWKALEGRRLDEALNLQMKMNELQITMRKLGRLYGRSVQLEAIRLRGLPVKKFPRWTTKTVPPEDRANLAAALKKAGLSVVPR